MVRESHADPQESLKFQVGLAVDAAHGFLQNLQNPHPEMSAPLAGADPHQDPGLSTGAPHDAAHDLPSVSHELSHAHDGPGGHDAIGHDNPGGHDAAAFHH